MSELKIPAERDFPRGHQERRARHVVRELSGIRRRRRLVLTIVPAVLVLLTAATGFTAYSLLRTEPSHFESIGCYDRADLGGDVTVVSADGRGAVAQCRELWDAGAVGEQRPPRLAACVLATGPIGVFPSVDDRTCERMGLADLSQQGEAESQRFVRMRNAVYAKIGTPASGSSRGSSHCVGEARARTIIRQILDMHGYADWKIAMAEDGFAPDRPCADVSFDGGTRTALLFASSRN
jgi:hypothetical protein